MELFKSGLKTVLGTGSSGYSTSTSEIDKGAETIERLIERLHSATLLDDRRDACRALRSLSKRYRVEVGAQGMDAIMNVLLVDKIDSEIMEYALETLQNITFPDLFDDEDPNTKDVGSQFTEIFIKKSENVATLLATLEEYDFRIRLKLIRVLTNLLTNRPREMQEILLVSPMGISKMMDLLSDAREVVRNEALLLLVALSKSNASIQKIIAFENGFDKILHIIKDEGYSDGGPVVEDCLHLFINLLKSNTSNQTFFREGSYIKLLLPFFTLPTDMDMGWPTQKVSNFYYMLQVVRILVSPLNPTSLTQMCQKSMKQAGILEVLASILMANGIPVETLTEAIITIGEVIRGSPDNQAYFSSVIAPSEPPRPALVLILMTLVNDRQLLSLRCAVLYCVQCFLFKNELSQAEIVSSLLPGSSAVVQHTITAGQLLCTGLFSKDSSVNWFSSIAMCHVILGNIVQKEALLKAQLITKPGQPAMGLLNHILVSLKSDLKPEVRLGFLQFISIWLEGCPSGVSQFLSNANAVPYLISQITSMDSDEKESMIRGICAFIMGLCLYFNSNTVSEYSKEALQQLITNRIGVEILTDGLYHISKSEHYLYSLKHPQMLAKHSSGLVFDTTFCLLFQKYEGPIVNQLNNDAQAHLQQQQQMQQVAASSIGTSYSVSSRETPNEVINRFKEVIRNQDETIAKHKAEIEQLTFGYNELHIKLDESQQEIHQLRNQLALAHAHQETSHQYIRSVPEDQHMAIMGEKDRKIQALELQLLKLEQIQNYQLNGSQLSNPVHEELISNLEGENKVLLAEIDNLKKEQEDLLLLLIETENRIPKGVRKEGPDQSLAFEAENGSVPVDS